MGCTTALLRNLIVVVLFFVWTPRDDLDPSRTSARFEQLDALALDPSPSALQARLDELELDWFEFEPTTGDGAFRPLYLPFEYECRSGRKDENQAYVFPHLLSYKFDFVPDNNAYYHPFFVFKRDRAVRALEAPPSHDRIREYADGWGGSHVFGGTLVQDGDLFGGNIRAYDQDGTPLFEREYPVELRYFELMGRMARDWIAFRGQAVTAELLEELERPMCSDPDALRLLGKAALVGERSPQEWRIYERILDLAPDFAELRHWYANQRQWFDGDVQRGQIERGKALADHLVLRALTEFRVQDCPDPELVEVYRESLRRAREISPEDPRLLAEEIYYRGRTGTLTLAEYDAYLWVPKRWPGFFGLHRKLHFRYRTRNALEKSLPLAISGLRSGAVPAEGGFIGEWSELVLGLTLLGDFQRARDLVHYGLQDEGRDYETALLLCCSGTALRELGRPKEASRAFAWAHEEYDQEHLFALQCLTGLEGGSEDPELLAMLVGDAWRPIVDARGLVAQGRHREALQKLELVALGDQRRPPGFRDDSRLVDPRFEIAMIRAEASLACGEEALAREATHHALLLAPYSRRARQLWERAHFLEPQTLEAVRNVEQFLRPTRRSARRARQPAADELERAAASSAALLAQAGSLKGDERRAFWWSQPAWSVERLAIVLARAGALDDALELYLAYADASQEISDAQEIHGRVFVRKLLARAEDDVRAAWLDRLSGLPSGPYWHYGEQGLRLYAAERYEEALPFFQKAVRTTTGDRWFSYHAGYCLRQMGDLEGAIDAFRHYLATRPEDGAALLELGKLLQRTGREAEACETLMKSLRTGKGPQEEAREALREAGLQRAGSLEDEGMTEPALQLLLAIDELGAADAALLEAIAEQLEALNRSQEAADYRERAGRIRDAADPGE